MQTGKNPDKIMPSKDIRYATMNNTLKLSFIMCCFIATNRLYYGANLNKNFIIN